MEWGDWQPEIDATLLYVVRGGEILLIHKKRGIGAGKLNGAGGKVDPGETTLEAAVREFEEELLATPIHPIKLGEVAFDVVGGASILIHVYRSDAVVGDPTETDEAVPVWAPLGEIPYDRMWADDEHWFPHLLSRRRFTARAQFDDDTLLTCEVFEGDEGWRESTGSET